MDSIVIKGAREHNLKGFDLEIPREKLTVITGVSGSGKSSLAFDTIYAEGERRYVESLSSYARQFFEQMEKPDVDSIEGLSPAIAIEQKTTARNPRSTVGTVTEIYDYMRLLFARVGTPFCYKCGKKITHSTLEEMVERILSFPPSTKIEILSPIVRGRKGEYRKELAGLLKEGYTRVKIDGAAMSLEKIPGLDKRKKHHIEVIVDRLVIRENITSRLAESLEIALRLSGGLVKVEPISPATHPTHPFHGGAPPLRDKRKTGQGLFFNEKLSCPECQISYQEITPAFFSFNSPQGACPECSGIGEKYSFDPELIIDGNMSLLEGAIIAWRKKAGLPDIINSLARHYGFDPKVPFKKLPRRAKNIIIHGSGQDVIAFEHRRGKRRYTFHEPFEGVLKNLERRRRETQKEETITELEIFMTSRACPLCSGSRLKKEALYIRLGRLSIWDVTRLTVKDALGFFNNLKLDPLRKEISRKVLKEIRERLEFLLNTGLYYLTLERGASTLSGGEGQRIRLATQIGTSLTGVLYVLDEPSIGLHQRDNFRLLGALKKLRDMGNTVIVVEHDESTIKNADFIVDMGPGAGEGGGEIVAKGSQEEITKNPGSITGKYLSGELSIAPPEFRKTPNGKYIAMRGMRENNLKGINVKIPIGLITCVTGVSGSGKSTLVMDTLYKNLSRRLYNSKVRAQHHFERSHLYNIQSLPVQSGAGRAGKLKSLSGLDYIDKVIAVDQSPIGKTPRSNPATYTGVFTPIRELFSMTPEAMLRGYASGRFSFNVRGGRCEKCRGQGVIKIEMHFLPDVYVRCDSCNARRYAEDTLQVRYKGKNIADCLDMTAEEALGFFQNIPDIREKLKILNDVGLGYIRLGQAATTLSGGEAQRIKLSRELAKKAASKTLCILDEPTTGLHFADIQKLLEVLKSLRDRGSTIVIIEHNLDVIKFADHIIDLGPEGGDNGGEIIAQGTPEQVSNVRSSYTGRFLKTVLKR